MSKLWIAALLVFTMGFGAGYLAGTSEPGRMIADGPVAEPIAELGEASVGGESETTTREPVEIDALPATQAAAVGTSDAAAVPDRQPAQRRRARRFRKSIDSGGMGHEAPVNVPAPAASAGKDPIESAATPLDRR